MFCGGAQLPRTRIPPAGGSCLKQGGHTMLNNNRIRAAGSRCTFASPFGFSTLACHAKCKSSGTLWLMVQPILSSVCGWYIVQGMLVATKMMCVGGFLLCGCSPRRVSSCCGDAADFKVSYIYADCSHSFTGGGSTCAVGAAFKIAQRKEYINLVRVHRQNCRNSAALVQQKGQFERAASRNNRTYKLAIHATQLYGQFCIIRLAVPKLSINTQKRII